MSADRKKILLVDDSMTIRKLARAILGADYDFVEAENGADASTVARAERPDLIVMDLNMPVKDGIEGLADLKSEPDYLGGDVGFFLVTPESHVQGGTCANGDCCATIARASAGEGYVYYSERKYNPDFNGASSWIHLLIYESQIFPSKYYFAWEDSNKSPNNDFTDLLTSVTGIQCSGAGVACDTGEKGLCAAGITECKNGNLSCNPLFSEGSEQCNGLDDDCD